MFITQAREIIEAVPTSKLTEKDASKLMRAIEEEEEAVLQPLLGDRLMDVLVEDYYLIEDKYGGITTDKITQLEDIYVEKIDTVFTPTQQDKTIKLLRNIQSALVYRMMANKIFSLATSFNLGGGANRASAGDYEPADDKHLQELRKEYFMNSRAALDKIFYILERDARESGMWTEEWKDSDGYFYKSDLLFPTLRSMKPFYPCKEPTKWLNLMPVIRYCQDTYIIPRVNEELFATFLSHEATLTDDEKKGLTKLRMALAYHIMAKEGNREDRNEAFTTADGTMSTFMAWQEKHLSAKKAEEGGGDDTLQHEQHPDHNHPCTHEVHAHQPRENEQEYKSFSMLWPKGVNRV